MKSAFDLAAAAHHSWQQAADTGSLASHTLMDAAAEQAVRAYLALLQGLLGWRNNGAPAIDLGAGSGHMTRTFRNVGIDMTAAERHDEGVDLLRRLNPDLPVCHADISSMHEPGRYGLIVAREIYPITRVAAFAEQHAMLGRLIDSLESGGVLLVAGSDACAPDCMDYQGMLRSFASDARVSRTAGPLIEPLVQRFPWTMHSRLACAALHALAAPLLAWKRRRGWVRINVIAFVRA